MRFCENNSKVAQVTVDDVIDLKSGAECVRQKSRGLEWPATKIGSPFMRSIFQRNELNFPDKENFQRERLVIKTISFKWSLCFFPVLQNNYS